MKQTVKVSNIIVLCVLLTLITGCKSNTETIHPQTESLTVAVYASGSLFPQHEYRVFSNIDGYLTDALLVEGDSIKIGQTLFRLANHSRDAQQQAVANIYKTTKENLSENSPVFMELKYRTQTSKSKLANDSLQWSRYKNLFAQNAISKSEMERIELLYNSSRNDFNALREQYSKLKNSTFLELQQAESNYKVSSIQQGDEQVKSFLNGMVFEIYKQIGDAVKPNEAMALVGDRNNFLARLSVDESDFEKLKIGQLAYISLDAFPGKVYKARVSKIYPKLNKVEQAFRVDAIFEDIPPVKIYGLNLEANIVVNEFDKVLTIPKKLLLPGDTLLVMKEGKETKVKITRGAEDMEKVQVLSGVDANTEIVVKKGK